MKTCDHILKVSTGQEDDYATNCLSVRLSLFQIIFVLTLIKSVLKLLVKTFFEIPLGLTAAALATDSGIQKNVFGSGITTLIVSNEEMNNIMKTCNSLEDTGLLITGLSEAK